VQAELSPQTGPPVLVMSRAVPSHTMSLDALAGAPGLTLIGSCHTLCLYGLFLSKIKEQPWLPGAAIIYIHCLAVVNDKEENRVCLSFQRCTWGLERRRTPPSKDQACETVDRHDDVTEC
jgi:hypothetical protein